MRPPAAAISHRPNFVVDLVRDHRGGPVPDVKALIDQCKPAPESSKLYPSGTGVLAGTLFFHQWAPAVEAVVSFWQSRLDGAHSLVPRLNHKVVVPEDLQVLENRLRALFAERIRRLIDGEEVKRWNEKRDRVLGEIGKVSKLLGKPKNIKLFSELNDKKKRLTCEKDLVEKRVKEFKSAMNCILAYLEGKSLEAFGEDVIQVLRLEGKFDWSRIHFLILRECRRLEEGLPIYAYRQEILEQIHSQQVASNFLGFHDTVGCILIGKDNYIVILPHFIHYLDFPCL